MKKVIITMSIALGMMLSFPSCGSQMERDADKMAKRAVEFEQTTMRMEQQKRDRSNMNGKRMSEQEYRQYVREYTEFANQMLEKYGESQEMKAEFKRMVDRKIENIKE